MRYVSNKTIVLYNQFIKLRGDDFIRLSARSKIAAIGTVVAMVLLNVILIAAMSGEARIDEQESVSTTDTTITQSYVSEAQDECIENEDTEKESVDTVEKLYIQYYSEQDAVDIAKVLFRECRGVPSVTEQACVAWTVLNRVDYYDSTIYAVVRAPGQFAFKEDTTVDSVLLELAYDVLNRWNCKKNGDTYVGRVLPEEYIYFEGRGGHNYFRDRFDGSYNIWGFSLESPYIN